MQRQPVTSSNIAEIGYDNELQTLEIMFKTGISYQYFNVPKHVYEQLQNADSVGKYFNAQIKGHFQEARL